MSQSQHYKELIEKAYKRKIDNCFLVLTTPSQLRQEEEIEEDESMSICFISYTESPTFPLVNPKGSSLIANIVQFD
ncbi:hypothetical protein ENUP19_0011G0044 [Entamoeba nuttalli]|uniref:Uncharacterized protein n=1 Tax=Entamoeba nuttalli TaxID=412467 RepID=A0ABQ0D866_9EUKA